jgi:hypothetical protein
LLRLECGAEDEEAVDSMLLGECGGAHVSNNAHRVKRPWPCLADRRDLPFDPPECSQALTTAP